MLGRPGGAERRLRLAGAWGEQRRGGGVLAELRGHDRFDYSAENEEESSYLDSLDFGVVVSDKKALGPRFTADGARLPCIA